MDDFDVFSDFAVVERATQSRVFLKDWEAEERNKGPAAKAKGKGNYNEWRGGVERNKRPVKAKDAAKVVSTTKYKEEWQLKGKGGAMGSSGFLLRCLNQIKPQNGRRPFNDPFDVFCRIDFHTVNLEKGEIYLNTLPPIVGWKVSTGDMVRLDSTIYVVGGIVGGFQDDKAVPPYPLPDVHHHYLGASCLDLSSSSPQKWVNTIRPEVSAPTFCGGTCVSLCGKIYSFGDFNCCPEVYDPNDGGGKWNKLSSGHDDSTISSPVLPDPDNMRILVHLEKSRQLVAFYPLGGDDGKGEWLPISNELTWDDVCAVADNIIYFYSEDDDIVTAYDIIKQEWLDCIWSSDVFDIGCYLTISPCPRNKGMMYLVGWGPGRDHTSIAAFQKFRVKRIDNSKLQLTPISMQCFKIPSCRGVLDFLQD